MVIKCLTIKKFLSEPFGKLWRAAVALFFFHGSGRAFSRRCKLRVLRLLNTNSHVSTRQIANKVGISNGSAHYVLTALIEKGLSN